MSWLARSIATSLRLDDDEDYSENEVASETPHNSSPVKRNEEERRKENEINKEEQQKESKEEEEEEEARRGVKDDLTEFKQTLTRQLWGVASFLAPPPDHSVSNLDQSEPCDRSASSCDEREPSDSGIGHDFSEIGGRFRNISKMASNYFPFGSEENERENLGEENQEELATEELGGEDGDGDWGVGGAIGITDEVLAFARNIAMHPETWLDFPLDEEEDLDDFDMSDAQREHALAVEQFAPRLAALRIELCPCHMTESYFWKVYFVLLHSRLNKQDTEILSTPQVMEARAMWMQELHKQTKPESDWFGITRGKDGDNVLHEDFECARTFDFDQTTSTTSDYETEKHPIMSTEMHFVDKSVIEEKTMIKTEDKDVQLVGTSLKTMVPNYEEDEDDWLDDEDSDLGGYKTIIPVGNEEDISFSDLEDDASNSIPIKSKRVSEVTETKTT